VLADFNQPVGHGAGQCRLSNVPICRQISTSTDDLQRGGTDSRLNEPDFRPTESPQSASADRSSSLLKINGLALAVRAGEGSCGKIRTPAGSRWDDTPHQTNIESTQSKRCGLLRTNANSIEKPAGL
jgi:hypothetical protein